ncbi:MAG: hypothetical protein ACTS9Y_01290 [Methylophilus sp.]|uniref:hypothetical protein n=1 Tax=Methylophilus sp. TaxID=29541 RepID=UPI003F9F20FB
MQSEQIDDVAAHVIRAAKSENPPYTFIELREVLKDIYSPKMTLQDSVLILSEVFQKAVMDRRLKIGFSPEAMSKLLLSPINRIMTDNMTQFPKVELTMETTLSIETLYNYFIHHIITILRLCYRGDAPELADDYLAQKQAAQLTSA